MNAIANSFLSLVGHSIKCYYSQFVFYIAITSIFQVELHPFLFYDLIL